MAVFDITAYPAHITASGGVQIEITRCIKRATVECLPNEVYEQMATIGSELGKVHGTVQVSADPQGRTPKGWKEQVQKGRDTYVFDKSEHEVAQ
ncbi:hypothetical protein ACHMW6_00080 (plasmid) [Pseudoduganella sp. UC29_106]|uniref:hypothetical protein n=1 Tax=Pseudoduganella sp. UC29_106 TaxID=3374553 RepID=UPI003756426C